MYQPRKSVLEMFDPLMADPPSTPKREEFNASPDNSDKENDAPRDPLSLSQYFNRTYQVKSLQKPGTPNGKLIDFGDASMDEYDELALLGPFAVAREAPLDGGDVFPSTHLLIDPHEENDTENITPFPANGPFVTPQNRRILGDIDVDAFQPPKPPVKQGALKISFLTAASSGSSPAEAPTTGVASSDSNPDNASSGPVITLYPPTFDSVPPTSSAPQISDKVDNYLSPQLSLPRTTAAFTPRRSSLSSEHDSHRVSMDLQSSLQLQLQNGDYSFNLINDKVPFLESSQELSFPESDDDSGVDEIVESVGVDDMLKSLTLQDKAVVAAKRIFSPTSERFTIASIPEGDSESSSKSETRAATPVLVSPPQDLPETKSTTTALDIAKKPAGSLRRPSLAPRPSISGLQPVTIVSKPPVRVLVPPSKRPPSATTTQRTNVVRPPARQSLTTDCLPKPVMATIKTMRKLTDGPRRILVQANDKSAPRTVSTSATPALKTQGPQRVLVRVTPGTTNPVKKPLGPSYSINPPAPTSRLPGPSRISLPGTLKTRTSSISRSAGRWV